MNRKIKWCVIIFCWIISTGCPSIVNALVINEIHFNPPTPIDDNDGEFLELYNELDIPVDLTGYSIGGITASLNGIINSREFLVLSSEPVDDSDTDTYSFESLYGNGDGILSEFPFQVIKFTGSLANTGEPLTIYRPGGEIVESYNYIFFLDSIADGGGFSLERINPYMPAFDSNFSISNTIWGTPGEWNSVSSGISPPGTSPVPEPSTLLLLLTGLIGLVTLGFVAPLKSFTFSLFS